MWYDFDDIRLAAPSEYNNETSGSITGGEFPDYVSSCYHLLKNKFSPCK
jgi:hypothetical protein